MIENLVKLGFVERSTSSIDRRQVTLTLSPEGEQVAVRVRRGVEKRFMTYLENLTSNEQQEVERGLHLLQKAFAPKSESL